MYKPTDAVSGKGGNRPPRARVVAEDEKDVVDVHGQLCERFEGKKMEVTHDRTGRDLTSSAAPSGGSCGSRMAGGRTGNGEPAPIGIVRPTSCNLRSDDDSMRPMSVE